MLNVCTTTTDNDYCTCGDVMMILFGSTTTAAVGSTQEIQHISRLIRRASAWVDGYVRRPLAQQVYSEALAGHGNRELALSRYPLVKVLRFFDSTSTGDATAICSSDYRVEDWDAAVISRDAGWRWTADSFWAETCFSLGLTPAYRANSLDRPWLVEYIAGYSVAGTTTTADGRTTDDATWTTGPTLPDDVVQATAVRAAEYWANPLGVAERRISDMSVSYRGRNTAIGVQSQAEDMLERYRSAV